MKTVLFFALLFLLILTTPSVSARSGCCSRHDGVDYCDTSIGKYVCNDGTYSPTCGCTYIPVCTKPGAIQSLDVQSVKIENSCNEFSVSASWDTDNDADGYSINISNKALTPDNRIDNTSSEFSTKLNAGTYYLTVKAINNCGNGPVITRKVTLNPDAPQFDIWLNNFKNSPEASFTSKCLSSLTVTYNENQSVISLDKQTYAIIPDQFGTYTFSAKGINGQVLTKELVYTPTPLPTTPEITAARRVVPTVPNDTDSFIGLYRGFGFVLILIVASFSGFYLLVRFLERLQGITV